MTDHCIFCQIIEGTLPADFVYQDEKLVVFKDIHPKAPVHLLIVPKTHIKSLNEIKPDDGQLLTAMLLLMPTLAREHGLPEGFRLVCNTGRGGGQEVDHLHFHLLGGKLSLAGF